MIAGGLPVLLLGVPIALYGYNQIRVMPTPYNAI